MSAIKIFSKIGCYIFMLDAPTSIFLIATMLLVVLNGETVLKLWMQNTAFYRVMQTSVTVQPYFMSSVITISAASKL